MPLLRSARGVSRRATRRLIDVHEQGPPRLCTRNDKKQGPLRVVCRDRAIAAAGELPRFGFSKM